MAMQGLRRIARSMRAFGSSLNPASAVLRLLHHSASIVLPIGSLRLGIVAPLRYFIFLPDIFLPARPFVGQLLRLPERSPKRRGNTDLH